MVNDTDLVDLVDRARVGDTRAWEELIRRFRGLIGAITRSFQLTPSDAADVAQTTWLRLVESIDRVRQPERLAAWIGTTARRECQRTGTSVARERPTADLDREREMRVFATPDHELLGAEERAAVRAAVETLSERHRHLCSTCCWHHRLPRTWTWPTRSRCRRAASARHAGGRSSACDAVHTSGHWPADTCSGGAERSRGRCGSRGARRTGI